MFIHSAYDVWERAERMGLKLDAFGGCSAGFVDLVKRQGPLRGPLDYSGWAHSG
jgi:hypothetical protein